MKVPPLPAEEHAQCCWALANSYRAAASRLLEARVAETFMPSLFLLLHALELHLKAFLFSQGMNDRQLRTINHDLLACLRACYERGFSKHVALSWREQMQIVRINRYYKSKELEYFVPRAKSFGSVETLSGAVDRVSKGVFNPITENTFRALASQRLYADG